jgi:hypothetical protein
MKQNAVIGSCCLHKQGTGPAIDQEGHSVALAAAVTVVRESRIASGAYRHIITHSWIHIGQIGLLYMHRNNSFSPAAFGRSLALQVTAVLGSSRQSMDNAEVDASLVWLDYSQSDAHIRHWPIAAGGRWLLQDQSIAKLTVKLCRNNTIIYIIQVLDIRVDACVLKTLSGANFDQRQIAQRLFTTRNAALMTQARLLLCVSGSVSEHALSGRCMGLPVPVSPAAAASRSVPQVSLYFLAVGQRG